MSDIAIKAEHLSKYYKLGTINSGTLRGDMQSWFARAFGKEDPNSKIGSDRFASTEDGFWALKDLNFEIKQGDRVGIIGKNGAGKSTLLKVLSRITAPTEGNVKIRGRIASLLEVGTGFHGELTGRENIYLNGAILGMKRREVTKKLDEIIAFSEIEKYIDTPVKRYSSGMYVRLAFAVAAHLDSEILIADEVLAVGDAAFQKKALGKMNELSTGQGRTVLFVSHNMGAVKNLCNKGIFLEQGKIMANSNIDSIVDLYFGSEKSDSYIDLKDYKPNYASSDIHVLGIRNAKEGRKNMSFYADEDIEFVFTLNSDVSKSISSGISVCHQKVMGVLFAVNDLDKKFFAEAGKTYDVHFKIKNSLAPGRYTIAFGINEMQNNTIWWGTDLAIFEILPTKIRQSCPHLMYVDSEINYKEV